MEEIQKKIRKKVVVLLAFVFVLLSLTMGEIEQVHAEEISGSLEILSNIEESMMQEYLEAFCKKYPEQL